MVTVRRTSARREAATASVQPYERARAPCISQRHLRLLPCDTYAHAARLFSRLLAVIPALYPSSIIRPLLSLAHQTRGAPALRLAQRSGLCPVRSPPSTFQAARPYHSGWRAWRATWQIGRRPSRHPLLPLRLDAHDDALAQRRAWRHAHLHTTRRARGPQTARAHPRPARPLERPPLKASGRAARPAAAWGAPPRPSPSPRRSQATWSAA